MCSDRPTMLLKLPKTLFLNSHDCCPLSSRNQPIILKEKHVCITGKQSSTCNLWTFLFDLSWTALALATGPKRLHQHVRWSLSLEEVQLGPDDCYSVSKELDQVLVVIGQYKNEKTHGKGVCVHSMWILRFFSKLKGLLAPKKFPSNRRFEIAIYTTSVQRVVTSCVRTLTWQEWN